MITLHSKKIIGSIASMMIGDSISNIYMVSNLQVLLSKLDRINLIIFLQGHMILVMVIMSQSKASSIHLMERF